MDNKQTTTMKVSDREPEHPLPKGDVGKMFDNIAPSYDKLNHVFSAGNDRKWRQKMIGGIEQLHSLEVLDIATGTGDVAIELLKKNAVHVTGIDISSEMLEICKTKIKYVSFDKRFTCINAAAELLPFADDTFDVVTIAFGVRNFNSIDVALDEIHRVLKPDGQLVIMEFFNSPIVRYKYSPYRFYMRNIVPYFGKMISKNAEAYTYLYSSINRFYSVKEFLNLLSEKRFSLLKAKRLMFGIAHIIYVKKNEKKLI